MKPTLIIRLLVLAILVFLIGGGMLIAQDSGQEFLKKFVGEWELTSKGSMGEGQPEMEASATMNAKMLGEMWVVCTQEGELPGMSYRAMQTIGYDAAKSKFVGTWVDSLTSHLWVYEGTLDESGSKLTLEAEGPHMTDPTRMAKYRDAYEFKGDDEVVATSSMLGDDGEWNTFMRGTGKRTKK